MADGECVGRAGCGAAVLGRTVLAILACRDGADEHPLSATATVVATATTIAGATAVMPIARAALGVACDLRSPGHCLVTIPGRLRRMSGLLQSRAKPTSPEAGWRARYLSDSDKGIGRLGHVEGTYQADVGSRIGFLADARWR